LKTLNLLMWATANQAARLFLSAQPTRRLAHPVLAPLTVRAHLSVATSPPFFFLFFPFSPSSLSPAGVAVERARSCGHVRRRGWSPRVESLI
jgi:hypothetical protein